MKITNKHNLPDPIIRAAESNHKPTLERLSVSQLINPVQLEVLRVRHWDEMEEDVSDRLWAIMGTAMHNLFHSHANGQDKSEQRLEAEIYGKTIVGRTDLMDEHGILTDYKYTSQYSTTSLKPEWEQQLNLYALLYKKNGIEVKGLQIVAFLRDWMQSKSEINLDYPNSQIVVMKVPQWDYKETESWLKGKVEAFALCESASDSSLLHCSPLERWAKDPWWQVVEGKYKAKNFSLKKIAEQWAEKNGGRVIQRGSEYVRCSSYCPVSKFCSQFVSAKENGEV